jgi:hypothetical protein
MAAGAALVTAEAAAEEAAEAVAVDALETRDAMEAMVEETPVLDVPAPEEKPKPAPRTPAAAPAGPKARRGFWPV